MYQILSALKGTLFYLCLKNDAISREKENENNVITLNLLRSVQ
jgi:hypothetical protein